MTEQNTSTVEIVVTNTDIIGVFSSEKRAYALDLAREYSEWSGIDAQVISWPVNAGNRTYNLPVGEWL